MAQRVAVIGAGLGGLSAAARLAAAGRDVTVFETQAGPGGKAFTETIDGFRFDSGPSLVTMLDVYDALFSELGFSLNEYLEFVKLDPICTYFYRDGTKLRAFADRDRLAEEFFRTTGEPPEHVESFLRYSSRIYDAAADLFLKFSLHDAATYFSPTFFRSLVRIGRIDALRTMNAAVEAHFRTPKLRQLFNRYATYNGSSPYLTPATLNIISRVEYVGGAYAVKGGVYAIPTALEKAGRAHGVRYRYNTPVERIATEKRRGRRVTGVVVAGEHEPFDVVISNADVTPTYERLLDDGDAPLVKRYRRLTPSLSGIVFFWGMDESFDDLSVNNIFFSEDYRREFSSIFDDKRCPDDPTVYVNVTSKVTANDAPAGGENWFVLVNAPCDTGQDWTAEVRRVRSRVIKKVSSMLGREIERHISCEKVLTPVDIQARTASHRGSLYGIASHSRFSSFMRHPNRSRRYRGLYFCGGSAHPGGGMPLAILSGKIVSDLVKRHER
ncbi:MAG: phytoene desaturase [Spirochaetaceae bacterium]|nr:MAG: phytoene desaturase [Spirochaetaceae bacterium]